MTRTISSLALGMSCSCACWPGLPLDVDLSDPAALDLFEFTDIAAWRHASDGEIGCVELFAKSSYQPRYRSPLALAILRDQEFGDFDLTLRARSTSREYAHRDLCIVFAYRDADHYCYAHLATRGDQNAHHVMLVDGAPRRPVSTDRTQGVQWGDEWHDLRIMRRGRHVEVFFDGETVIVADAPPWYGRIGFGSFDDTGCFARLSVAEAQGAPASIRADGPGPVDR